MLSALTVRLACHVIPRCVKLLHFNCYLTSYDHFHHFIQNLMLVGVFEVLLSYFPPFPDAGTCTGDLMIQAQGTYIDA